MRKAKISAALGALALMASSVGSAATLAVTPPSSGPFNIGDVFALSVDASGFVNDIGGITLTLSFDSSVLTLTSAVLPAAGPLRAATGTFLVNNNPTFDWLPGSELPNGSFAMGTLNFQAIGGGSTLVTFSDDGGIATGWFDGNTADYIGGTVYQGANVSVVPAPATLGLLASGLVGLMVRSAARRKRAIA